MGETRIIRYNDESVPIEKLSFAEPIRKTLIITKRFVFAFLSSYLQLHIFTVPGQGICNSLSFSFTKYQLRIKDLGT